MTSLSALILLTVLLFGADARREKLGKLSSSRFQRQVNQRDYNQFVRSRQLQSPFPQQPLAFPAPQPSTFQTNPLPQRQVAPQPSTFQANPLPQRQVAPQPSTFQVNPLPQRQVAPQPSTFQSRPQVSPQPNLAAFEEQVLNQVLANKPQNSQLLSFRQIYGPSTTPGGSNTVKDLIAKLPDNATLIHPEAQMINNFKCDGRKYGYYADVDNKCKIFHVCVPLKDIFKSDPNAATVPDVTFHYSFICPYYTSFSQDSLTCAWTYEAVPCESSPLLYNKVDFFKIPPPKPAATTNPVYQPNYQLGR